MLLRMGGSFRRARSELLDLSEFELDRRGAAEDRHRDLHARAALVDLFHRAVERREWAIRHAPLLADLEGDRGLRPLDAFLHLTEDALGLGLRDRERLLVGAEK